jgi:hypothetical protein
MFSMRIPRLLFPLLVAGIVVTGPATTAQAAGPRNPYSGFNLSGINYGAQQWDRDQRAGRVVWPYYNTPSRSYYRGSNVSVGGVTGGTGGTVIQGGTYRSSPRTVRRWRR